MYTTWTRHGAETTSEPQPMSANWVTARSTTSKTATRPPRTTDVSIENFAANDGSEQSHRALDRRPPRPSRGRPRSETRRSRRRKAAGPDRALGERVLAVGMARAPEQVEVDARARAYDFALCRATTTSGRPRRRPHSDAWHGAKMERRNIERKT
jgi:hypothetical protein